MEGMRRAIRIVGEFKDLETLKNIVISSAKGAHIYLKDIAEIKDTYAERESFARLNGNNVITLNLFEKNEKSIKISFDLSNNQVIYNSIYDNMLETYNLENYFINKDKVKIEVYLDKYTIEVFLNSGEKVFSFTNFTPNKGTEISLESKELSTLLSLKKCDIENSFLNFPK